MKTPLKLHSRTLYLRGRGETEAQAVVREKKLKKKAAEWDTTESGVVRRLVDENI